MHPSRGKLFVIGKTRINLRRSPKASSPRQNAGSGASFVAGAEPPCVLRHDTRGSASLVRTVIVGRKPSTSGAVLLVETDNGGQGGHTRHASCNAECGEGPSMHACPTGADANERAPASRSTHPLAPKQISPQTPPGGRSGGSGGHACYFSPRLRATHGRPHPTPTHICSLKPGRTRLSIGARTPARASSPHTLSPL